MSLALQPEDSFTYGDYLTWPEGERWEVIDGIAWDMSPAPSVTHQRVSRDLLRLLGDHFGDQGCEVLAAPCDILLPEADEADEEVETVVQPDLFVVCDPAKVGQKRIRGAPDLVVEILSPSTARKDEGIKRERYARAGVPEYWLVHPIDRVILRYALNEGAYGISDVFGVEDGAITSTRFPDLMVDLTALFRVEPTAPSRSPRDAGPARSGD